jgi:nitrite reductase/ring-hydroxylating ferredoxin subunit/uncharacterized membrane protein
VALERRRVVVAPREKIDENPSQVDRWMQAAGWLDRPGAWLQRGILKLYELLGEPGRTVKDLLHGTRLLGHALHPAVANVPVGALTVMVLADWLAVFSRAIPSEVGSFSLIIGVLGMAAAALAGVTDYTGTDGKERRYASVHGLLMSLVLVAMVASLVMRYRPSAASYFGGVLLSSAAYLVLLFSAYLGGHLAFGFGTMVNHNALLKGSTEWTKVGFGKDFPEGRMVRVQVADMPVLVVRLGGRLNAISAACSHAGGPLEEGSLEGDTVTCPWHGSRFCVSDGRVKGGPATYSQPALLVREDEGTVQVRLPASLK